MSSHRLSESPGRTDQGEPAQGLAWVVVILKHRPYSCQQTVTRLAGVTGPGYPAGRNRPLAPWRASVPYVPHEVNAAKIAALVAAIDQAAFRLGYSGTEVLDVEELSVDTGLAPERVRQLLEGAEPEQPPTGSKDEREAFYRKLVGQRLSFLRKRADPSSEHGEALRVIGDEVGLSHALVSRLAKGTRSARVDYSSPLEARYQVPHGFLSQPEGPALADRLEKIKDGLWASVLREEIAEFGGKQMALRQTGGQPPSLEELVSIMDAVKARQRIQNRRAGASPDDLAGE